MTTPRLILACAAALCVFNASNAFAQASCTISTTSVNFGNYNVFGGSDTDSTGTITINCNNMAHNISVTLGKGASSSYNPRTMKKGAESLNYNLFRDAARTSVWGDGGAPSLRQALARLVRLCCDMLVDLSAGCDVCLNSQAHMRTIALVPESWIESPQQDAAQSDPV